MCTKECGSKTRHTERDFTFMLMVLDTKEIGLQINNMAKAVKFGPMAQFLKATTFKVKSTVKVFLCGLMTAATKENLKITKLVVKVNTNGKMDEFLLEDG